MAAIEQASCTVTATSVRLKRRTGFPVSMKIGSSLPTEVDVASTITAEVEDANMQEKAGIKLPMLSRTNAAQAWPLLKVNILDSFQVSSNPLLAGGRRRPRAEEGVAGHLETI